MVDSPPKKIDPKDGSVASFINPRREKSKTSTMMGLASNLAQLREKPDTVIGFDSSSVPEAEAPVVEKPVPQSAPVAPVQERTTAEVDPVSYEAPDDEPVERRGRKSKKPEDRLVERSFPADRETVKRLQRLANLEGVRLDGRYSVAHIIRHLIDYALSHVEDDAVLPGPDGKGLHISK